MKLCCPLPAGKRWCIIGACPTRNINLYRKTYHLKSNTEEGMLCHFQMKTFWVLTEIFHWEERHILTSSIIKVWSTVSRSVAEPRVGSLIQLVSWHFLQLSMCLERFPCTGAEYRIKSLPPLSFAVEFTKDRISCQIS